MKQCKKCNFRFSTIGECPYCEEFKCDRKIVLDDGRTLNYSEQMNLASKVINMIISGEIEPIKTEKITSNSIQVTKLNIPIGEEK